jgi:hypothetical protein
LSGPQTSATPTSGQMISFGSTGGRQTDLDSEQLNRFVRFQRLSLSTRR